jgi:hypothetical protein
VFDATLSDGDTIIEWKDLSGKYDLTGSATYRSSGLNSKHTIEFGSSWLSSETFDAGTNQTVFVVFQMPAAHSWGYIVGHGFRDDDWALRRYGFDTSKFAFEGPTSGIGQLTVDVALDVPQLALGKMDGNNPWELQTYSSTHGFQNASYNHTNYDGVNDVFKLGAINSGGGDNSNAKISEVIYFNKTLDESEITKIKYYLSKKWGLESTVDSDGDGYSDNSEEVAGASPIDSSELPSVDFSDSVDAQIGEVSGLDEIESNLKLWLDASNIDFQSNATLSDGDAISEWNDLSGNGNNATQTDSINHSPYQSLSSLC